MRPAGLPAALGIGYWHVAYRLLVRAKLRSGEEITGLYFVRSEADQPLIAAAGISSPTSTFTRPASG
jgi:hypothetical protein